VSEKPAGGRSIGEVLDLLKDPDFCADAHRTIMEAAEITARAANAKERQARLEQLGQPFFERWGVAPPTSGELLDSDPRRRCSDVIASGRWGVVPVFPWTANRQILSSLKTIRSVIRKQHRDALITRHAQLVIWLQILGFDRPAIARAVFQRRKGLRRPTKAEAIDRMPEDQEQQFYEHYRGLGLTPKQVEQKVYKKLRGSEAPASAAVRMTEQRYVERLERLNEHLATPVRSEPLSCMLTTLYRALLNENSIENNTAIRHHAIAVRDAFLAASRPPRARADCTDVAVQRQLLEALISDRWGIVLVFPWTTDPELRVSVTKLRTLMRERPQDGAGHADATRPAPFEPLSDALISLFRALSDQDDVVVRRYAAGAWATFLRPGA